MSQFLTRSKIGSAEGREESPAVQGILPALRAGQINTTPETALCDSQDVALSASPDAWEDALATSAQNQSKDVGDSGTHILNYTLETMMPTNETKFGVKTATARISTAFSEKVATVTYPL